MTLSLKNIISVFSTALILGCEQKALEIRYYPSDRESPEANTEYIGLDTTKLNFGQIANKLREHDSVYTNLVLEFEDEQIKKRVVPYVYGYGCISENNMLKVRPDSILIDDNYHISELNRILKKHYSNWGKNFYYSDSPEKALVELTIDENSDGKKIKDTLAELTRSFDKTRMELSDTIELRIFFNHY